MSVLDRITTKDFLAVMVVGAALFYAGVSMMSGKPLDAGTIGMAGIIVGHYFGTKAAEPVAPEPEPLPAPATGEKVADEGPDA